jgi:hypothetical protein
MKLGYVALAGTALLYAGSAQAQSFVNGGFETGNANGWQQGGISRASIPNATLGPEDFTIGSGVGRSAAVAAGTLDPIIGAAFGTTVYNGAFSYRVEDTQTGGLASLLQQRVNNYQDANIFFAWKAVLENGGHTEDQSAEMVIVLRDLTTNTDLIRRVYNAGGGTDARFTSAGRYYYTANWQIEQLAIGPGLAGHDFLLSVIAADCLPTAHTGYVYLDGFGAVTPPAGGVPEPATWAMMIMGFGLMGGAMRRQRASVRFNTATA